MSKNEEVARGSDKGAPRNEVNCWGRRRERRRGMALHQPWSNRTLCLHKKKALRRREEKKKWILISLIYSYL